MEKSGKLATATLAGGCFWCIETIFADLKGVDKVVSGYIGGAVKDPSYKEVCSGETGHAEAIQIHYDPAVISYDQLLEVFWAIHDPTTLNRQGNDAGTQYRSAIFYQNEEEKKLAQASITNVAPQVWDGKIVTSLEPFTVFYPAEDYHQNYFKNNPDQAYCQIVINPKVKKFKTTHLDWLKPIE
ncbi:MAG: peptide-methionine (S)-S-oxide reductase MsrA [Saprospiraceae bacterium]